MIGLLVTAGACALGAAPAAAHTEFTGSDPGEGAQLAELPAAVLLSYSEDVAPQFVETAVITPAGTALPASATVEGRDVSVDLSVEDVLSRADEEGSWQVVARVVGTDGHPVEHTTTFALVGEAVGSGADAAVTTDPTTDAATDPAAESPTGPSADPAAALTEGLPRWAVGLGATALVAAAGAALLVQLRRRPPQD